MAENLITMGVGNWGDEEEEDEEAVAARMAVVSEFLLCSIHCTPSTASTRPF